MTRERKTPNRPERPEKASAVDLTEFFRLEQEMNTAAVNDAATVVSCTMAACTHVAAGEGDAKRGRRHWEEAQHRLVA